MISSFLADNDCVKAAEMLRTTTRQIRIETKELVLNRVTSH